MRGKTWSLSVDADLLRVAELVRTGNDDAIAFFQAGHDFHVAPTPGAGLDRAARGAAAFDHPGKPPAVLRQERAALVPHHVLPRVEPDARRQPLDLPQAGRQLPPGEPTPGVGPAVSHPRVSRPHPRPFFP